MRGFTESVNNIVYFPEFNEDELFTEEEKTKRRRKKTYAKEMQRNNAVRKPNKRSKVKSKHKNEGK